MSEQALQKMASGSLAASEPISLMDVIRRAASDPSVDVEKMERLMALQERLAMRQSEADFNGAMRDCQTAMRIIAADASNPQTRSKYASYGALDYVLRPIYTQHGFNVSFDTADGAPPDHIRVVCIVGHCAGFTRSIHLDMPSDGKGAKGGDVMTKTHATGAALTYGRRYLLLMAFNLVVGETDNDGNRPADKISAEQKEQIIALLKETQADIPKFLAYMAAPSVDDIKANKFTTAIRALEKKRAAK